MHPGAGPCYNAAGARALVQETVRLYAAQTQLEIVRLSADLQRRIDTVREEVAREVQAARAELKGEMAEIKGELREQRSELVAHGRDIVEIKVRLNEGDKRFVSIEGRMDKAETRGQDMALSVAKLAGAAGAGGAITAAVMKLFG